MAGGFDPRPLVLTALLEPAVQARFEALRRLHFPAERNQVPAHVTLFHQLPGRELEAVRRRLRAVCGQVPPQAVAVTEVQFRGSGVAYKLRSPGLVDVRGELADGWDTLLIPQDRAGFQPHMTVQNKAEPAVARESYRMLSSEFRPFDTLATGIAIWRYCGGPWEALGTAAFRGR